MANKAILAGLALVLLGVIASLASGSESFTSWIPAIFGVVLGGLGIAGRAAPNLNRHLMHAAAVVALVAVLGSLGSAIGRGATGWALTAQLGTAIIAGVFLFFAVQSFITVRRERKQPS